MSNTREMTIVTGLTTEQVTDRFGAYAEDNTCSTRCGNKSCTERLWLVGSWCDHDNKLVTCPKCGRMATSPFLNKNG